MKHTPPALYIVPVLILAASLSGCGQKGDLYMETEQATPAHQEAGDGGGDDADDGDDDKD